MVRRGSGRVRRSRGIEAIHGSSEWVTTGDYGCWPGLRVPVASYCPLGIPVLGRSRAVPPRCLTLPSVLPYFH